MLAALVTAAGAIPVVLPTAADNPEALDAAISQALSPETNASLFLLTGGVSAGKFDLVEDALARAGARILFDGVAIQPGKPLVFGHFPRAGQPPLPFFGLPGNPISSAVTFHLFAAPILAALAGDSAQTPRFTLAGLKGPWHGKPGLTRFLPAHCDFTQNPTVRLIPWQGSGDLAAFARANCLAVIPPDATDLGEGSPVQILLT
jgi:molybdopterin molybdotransferase